LAMAGDGSRAQAITEELDHRFPEDTLLHQVSIPGNSGFRRFISVSRTARYWLQYTPRRVLNDLSQHCSE
jgi:hypothetical protein